MTTDTTVLTDEQIMACFVRLYEKHKTSRIGELHVKSDLVPIGRAIEQAVLQSEQVQAWKKDAEAFRLMVSKRLTVSVRELGHEVEVFHMDDCLAWPACDPNADDEARTEVARSAIATAAAAMEKQP